MGGDYMVYLLNLTGIWIVVALVLNLLTGCTGLVSFGHAALVSVGAYTAGVLVVRHGIPFWVAIPAAVLVTALIGIIIGLPALRMKGAYLALATLAAQFIIEHVIVRWESLTGGASGLALPEPGLGPFSLDTPERFYYVVAGTVVALAFGIANIMRSRLGRALLAVRDSEIAAETMGVNLARYKALAFGISAGYAGAAGGLYACYISYISPESFTFIRSIEFVLMIVIGGLGSILGSLLGAMFVTLLPELIRSLEGTLRSAYPQLLFPDLKNMVLGLALILMIAFRPDGLAGLWRQIKRYWTTWPF